MNPTNRCTRADVIEWIKPSLEKEGLKDYTINIFGSSEKGDGYLGDITFAEAIGKLTTGEEKVYNFVLKCGKKSKELRDLMPVRKAFENEIFFYTKILPTLMDFQAEKGVTAPFKHVPKCYDTLILDDMEVLILENIKKREFALHNRKLPMNRSHILKVLEAYGKYHAISYALRKENPELYAQMAEPLADIFKLMREANNFKSDDVNVYEHIIKAAEEENEPEIVEKCNALNEKLIGGVFAEDTEDPYAVLLHGDCWNNNFMFKHKDKENTIASEVCLLDFQLCRSASPVYDLGYFLFTCLGKEDVDSFDEYIDFYYDNLSNSLKEMGHDAAELLPFEELQKQWKKFSLFGLSMLPTIVRVCLSEEDEVLDLVEAAESGTNVTDMFKSTIKSMDQYRDRTIPIMKLAINKQFI